MSVGILISPLTENAMCNARCKGCYYFQGAGEGKIVPANQAISVLEELAQAGYKGLLLHSEVLLYPNFPELFMATGKKSLKTNGKMIAQQGDPLLDKIADAGIEEIVMTASLTGSHQSLDLADSEIVQRAFDIINSYNSTHPNPIFRTVATIILTSENYADVPELCRKAIESYKVKRVKFIAYIPLNEGEPSLAPTVEQLKVSLGLIKDMRRQYMPDELYIIRGGTLGPLGLDEEATSQYCPAGESRLTIRSMEDGSPVTPCFFVPDVVIGEVRDRKIVIDEEKRAEFLQKRDSFLKQGYCPALAIAREKYCRATTKRENNLPESL